MAITLRKNMTKSTIRMNGLSFIFLHYLPVQPHLKPVSLRSFCSSHLSHFSVLQAFRTSTYPQLHLPENIFSYLTLAHPSDHNLNVSSSARPSLADQLFCTLFSLMVHRSPFPEPVIIYMSLSFLHHSLPSAYSSSYTQQVLNNYVLKEEE